MSNLTDLSFKKYDSAEFASFPESIVHSKKNPLLIENLSDHRSVVMDNRIVKVQETTCLFKDLIHFFDNDVEEMVLPIEEYYRPEMTAKRLYDSYDLWYVLLILNNIYTVNRYNQKVIKYIPALKLAKIEKFTGRAKRVIRQYDENLPIDTTMI